jgi:hypothetical protein
MDRKELKALCRNYLPNIDLRKSTIFFYESLEKAGLIGKKTLNLNFHNDDTMKLILWNSSSTLFLRLVKHPVFEKIADGYVWKMKFVKDFGMDLDEYKEHGSYKNEYTEFVEVGDIHKQELMAYEKGYYGLVRVLIQKRIDDIVKDVPIKNVVINELDLMDSRSINGRAVSISSIFCLLTHLRAQQLINNKKFKQTVIDKINFFKTFESRYPNMYQIVGDCIDKIEQMHNEMSS